MTTEYDFHLFISVKWRRLFANKGRQHSYQTMHAHHSI